MAEYVNSTEMINNLKAMKEQLGYEAIDIDGMIKGLQDNVEKDVAPIVRCKDCKYSYKTYMASENICCRLWACYPEENGYCYKGKKRC